MYGTVKPKGKTFMTDQEKTFTQADIDGLNSKHQEEIANLKTRLKEEYDRKADGIAKKVKAEIEEATRKANMSELEKLQEANKDLTAKLQASEDTIALTNQKDEIRAYLNEIGVDQSNLDYVFIPKDIDGTKARANAFKEMIDGVKKATFENNIKSTIPQAGTSETDAFLDGFNNSNK